MKWGAGGILVQLVLDADHIRPGGVVEGPGLVESVCMTVKYECVVAILRGTDALVVPLNVVPAGRPVRTGDSIENPGTALAIPGRPVAVSKVALAADHEFLAAENHPEIELRGPEVGFCSGVVVGPEIPQKGRQPDLFCLDRHNIRLDGNLCFGYGPRGGGFEVVWVGSSGVHAIESLPAPYLYAFSSTKWVAFSEHLRSVIENPNA